MRRQCKSVIMSDLEVRISVTPIPQFKVYCEYYGQEYTKITDDAWTLSPKNRRYRFDRKGVFEDVFMKNENYHDTVGVMAGDTPIEFPCYTETISYIKLSKPDTTIILDRPKAETMYFHHNGTRYTTRIYVTSTTKSL